MAHDCERPNGTRSRIPTLATSTSAVAADPRAPSGRPWFGLRPAATGPNGSPPTASPSTNTSRFIYQMAERGAQASSATVDQIRLPNLSPATFPRVEDPAKADVNQAAANEIEAATRLLRARLK